MARSTWAALRTVFANGRRPHAPRFGVTIRLESLESRETPASFVVTTPDDTNDLNPGDGKAVDANGHVSLRSAIQELNWQEAIGVAEPLNTISFPTAGADGAPPPPMTIALLNTLDQIKVNVDIIGMGKDVLTVTRGQTQAVGIFNVAKEYNVSISNMTIAGGVNTAQGGSGGGIHNEGNLEVTGCTIQDCVALAGGGIYNTGEITIQGCTLRGNTATSDRGGGLLNAGGQATLFQTVFDGNRAPDMGGRGGGFAQIAKSASTTVTDCTFEGNIAVSSGGGIYVSDGTFNMSGGLMFNNNAGGQGGGLWGDGGSMTFTGVPFTGNTAAANGGAVATNLLGTSSCTLQNCNFSNNQCGNGFVGPNVAWTGSIAPTVPGCTGLNPGEPAFFKA